MKRCTVVIAAALLAATTLTSSAQQAEDGLPMTLQQKIAAMEAQNQKLRERLVQIEQIVDEHVAANEQLHLRLRASGQLLRELAGRLQQTSP